MALAVFAVSPAAGSAQPEPPLGMDGPTVRIDASKPIFDAGPFLAGIVSFVLGARLSFGSTRRGL